MRTFPQAARADVSHLSREAIARLRALLLADSCEQTLQRAQHEALASQLRGQTDVDSVLERELAEAGAARVHEALADIDHAIARLDAGTYGACEECGLAIPFERLEAIPAARFCVACSGRRLRLTR
ncbi:MAG TPA: TraR/DksA C4-type zinc finger protein [Acidimicrobiales bacterium]|jgi:DnaK suppressor protein|nr:TraR/DksA C4-type zinc finger protein [Acidimicrobiales bacterium]